MQDTTTHTSCHLCPWRLHITANTHEDSIKASRAAHTDHMTTHAHIHTEDTQDADS
jgi:hypothetical protein